MNEYLRQITRLLKINSDSVEGMMVVNRDGIIEYYKASGTLGGLSEDFVRQVRGKHLLEVYPELTEETSTVIRTLRTGTITVGEQQVLTSGDFKLTMTTTTYPILGEDGTIEGAVDIAQLLDIADRTDGESHRTVPSGQSALDNIVTRNAAMEQLKRMVKEVAKNDSATLIYGETGTGKELFAQALHVLSARKDKPFIAQNCAAIPVNLLESMFFGTERGGFTGAESKKGLFELANGGTLFLDEINSMDTAMQAKLLKVLEEQKVRRIGGKEDVHFDVRIVCASNEVPERLIEEGRLRSDFYYRVGVVRLWLPPLRERPEDIPLLTRHYIHQYNQKMGRHIQGLSQMTQDLFQRWFWPGNIRELKNTIEGAFNVETSDLITLDSVKGLWDKMEGESQPVPEAPDGPVPAAVEPGSLAQIREQLSRGKVDLGQMLAQYETAIITEALHQTSRLNAAAEKLSISPQKLQYRMEKLKLKEIKKTGLN